MIAALEKGTNDAIVELLGDAHNDELFTEDEAAERENRKLALAAAKEQMSLREDDADTRTVLIGKQEWPVPFPIVRGDKGWSFDLEAGLYELLARRIGANELAAHRFAARLRRRAAGLCRGRPRQRRGAGICASPSSAAPGKKDGLYWETAEGSNEPASPLLSFVTRTGRIPRGSR